jgi:hypothetical protein
MDPQLFARWEGGLVLSRGRTSAERVSDILQTILRLEEQRSRQGKIVEIERANQRIWNLDRANRLFCSFLEHSDNWLPSISDPLLLELVRRLRNEQADEAETSSDDWSMENLHEWVGGGFIYELKYYEHTRRLRGALALAAAWCAAVEGLGVAPGGTAAGGFRGPG